jgi:hypothetical protein
VTVARLLLWAFLPLAVLAMAGSAHAQGAAPAKPVPVKATAACPFPLDPLKLCGKLTGNVQTDLQAVWQRLVAVTGADLNYAIAMAGAANTNSAKVRLQCLQGIKALNDQANGVGLKNTDGSPMTKPDPALITNVETVAELADNLSPQGALFTSCAGAANLFKATALQVVNALVTGAVGIAALPAGL